ncbi:NADH:flavin oxidoreductase/NADH oxidase family protein [Thalassolituus alkanivorans]|uniref:NADH:flavin oxidoreductase/NADH oxidase family protein n=1 Tax=Thalassolituus alkanivorans TaxID=2881055 RepID=UPI001E3D1B0F|nr:NADH:flavin oxidoreductase/NADH oxidase family protein [Thalassolituus alkanivorans]MCB2387276.1 NADH:flavin oxidoreductase/NADH oxidase family protein [Thalassolituus alkanivorans]MCB2424399.1 NADH:flavin oxidoreductase/NADH oxidase family protein [Thalassolituus alkanivorans]
MSSVVFTPLTLPNGQQLANRIAKAAMEENMGDARLLPDAALTHLYRRWGQGGSGLIITGNVMVDHLAMTGPGGLALEAQTPLAPFIALAQAAKEQGAKIWMQINHPGRQVYAALGGKVLSASAVAVDLGKHSHLFARPQAMTPADIGDVIERFVTTARRAEEAGFDGVEIHAAHGYLLSQFLSPLTNQRTDEWGGSLENRARLLLEITRRIRAVVKPGFAVAVKLNSADFQRGGFDIADAKAVVEWLNPLAVDAIEISGGSYEAPAMQGRTADGRTLAREAYFLEFAAQIAAVANMPVMSTGGITRLQTAEQVVNAGVALLGMASALAVCPDLPKRWQQNPAFELPLARIEWKDKAIASVATMALIKRHLRRWGSGAKKETVLNPLLSLILDRVRLKKLIKRYRKLIGV